MGRGKYKLENHGLISGGHLTLCGFQHYCVTRTEVINVRSYHQRLLNKSWLLVNKDLLRS